MNTLVKGEGGAVGLTEDPQALERWLVAGHEISRLILEFENSFQSVESQTSKRHHEQNPNTRKTFAKDANALVATSKEMGNPFLEDNGDNSLSDTIKKNNYPLFKKVSVKQPSKMKEQVKYLETNCKLLHSSIKVVRFAKEA